jgi:hypothetical protein
MFSSTNDGYFLHKQKKVITLWLNIRLQQNKTKKVLLEDFLALNKCTCTLIIRFSFYISMYDAAEAEKKQWTPMDLVTSLPIYGQLPFTARSPSLLAGQPGSPTFPYALVHYTVLVRGRKTSSFSLGVSYVLRAGGIRGAGGQTLSSSKELLLHATTPPPHFLIFRRS